MTSWRRFITIAFVVVYFGLSITMRDVMAVEEANYSILEKEKGFELRQYESHIVAETVVEGGFDEVGNEGFRRLYQYISGNNRMRHPISMTAPVSQEVTSEKIAMTAPVGQERMGGQWRITFVMPSRYTMETLPEPLDARVELKRVPGHLTPALRYSGTWSRKRYEERKTQLLGLIEKRGLRPIGEPVFARYNPPYMPWFLRRNEVLIPVERVGQ